MKRFQFSIFAVLALTFLVAIVLSLRGGLASRWSFRPPFWNYLRMDVRFRVVIYDCRTQQVIAGSRWFRELSRMRMTPDGSGLLAKQGDAVLIWRFPEVRPDALTPLDRTRRRVRETHHNSRGSQ